MGRHGGEGSLRPCPPRSGTNGAGNFVLWGAAACVSAVGVWGTGIPNAPQPVHSQHPPTHSPTHQGARNPHPKRAIRGLGQAGSPARRRQKAFRFSGFQLSVEKRGRNHTEATTERSVCGKQQNVQKIKRQ